ncbi:VOC family protein [Aquibium carbonis]|uniref:VOC family protein n=1 Tax=Aquibium carbonis TaxID=2495581 RepID=A0A429Z107_9HYPH|nr:VOC family protein [Aquibium carbonis]RST87395.1 VOC family protein [Aquibium carbonis]
MEPRVSIVTLGVHDLDRAVRFYEAMGLTRHAGITEGVAFYQMGGIILSLFPRGELAKDAGIDPDGSGFSGIALAYNTRSEAEVDAVLSRAVEAGGTIVRPAGRAFWGGRTGYFADAEGHLWEVAHNSTFPIAADGSITLPD